MSNWNFFRLRANISGSTPPPRDYIQCDIEEVNFSGGPGVYEFEGNLGYTLGGITASFESYNVPDRFELFYPDWDTKVADSLFVGDSLPNTTVENAIRSATQLGKYEYDPTNPSANAEGFVLVGTQGVNFSNDDIVDYNASRPTTPSDGNVGAISGSATQIGVMGGWPGNGVGGQNGQVRLSFEKTLPNNKLYVRVTGCSSNTAWDMYIIGCPGSTISI